jgi:hypothetical protein
LCIKLGCIPEKWKTAQVYLIPKGKNWEYDLNNTRPIALLETMRKCLTRIINKRLSKVIKEREILKGLNYAGLPGCSTEEPIHIVNALVEEAKEEKKELWLLFQDMRKAFDSVSLVALEKAMKRIKLPEKLMEFLLNLFRDRRIRIITSFGLTEVIVAKDGIDQGEVVSPLL